jgi:tetratricopeptide (TPR) repeat protein
VEARYYAARTLRLLGRNDDARAAYQNFALTYPENPKAPDAWWAIGELYEKDKRFGDAASSFERIKVFHPKSRLAPLALSMAGRYFEAAGIQENAKKSYLALLNDYPTSDQVPLAHANLGAIYIREGNYGAAHKELQRATEGGAGTELTGIVSLQLGKLALVESASSEAERLFKKVAAMSLPDSLRSAVVEARVLLGTIYQTSGRRAEAARVLEEAAGDSAYVDRASTEKSMMLLGQTYFALQQYKRSADVFETVLRTTTDSSTAASAAIGLGKATTE